MFLIILITSVVIPFVAFHLLTQQMAKKWPGHSL